METRRDTVFHLLSLIRKAKDSGTQWVMRHHLLECQAGLSPFNKIPGHGGRSRGGGVGREGAWF